MDENRFLSSDINRFRGQYDAYSTYMELTKFFSSSDLLIGAYGSNAAYLLLARPIINISTRIDDSHLQENIFNKKIFQIKLNLYLKYCMYERM